MDMYLGLVMVAIGLVGSFFSGLFGIGGAIINFPLLLFIPSLLGVAHFTAQEVASISMFQVFFSSLSGILAYWKKGKKAGNPPSLIHKGLVLYMGSSILLGSLLGGLGSKYLSAGTINVLYGVLAIAAVVLMLFPARRSGEEDLADVSFRKPIAVLSAFAVGIVSGIVGAGGAFVLIPIMLTVLKIPTRVTIASSLAIVFISAIGGVLGKISAGHILLVPTLFTVIGSVIGAPVGSRVSTKIDVKLLRYGLIAIISFTAIKIWASIF